MALPEADPRPVGLGDRGARLGAGGLLAAAGIVAIAIAVDGVAARALNGLGALCWLTAAALLARSLRTSPRWGLAGGASVLVVLLLALVLPPSDLFTALVGFSAAGALVALLGRDRPLAWALTVPAFWLPLHLTLAVGRAVLSGEPRVRTDPPPTASLVPLGMVLAAAAGGALVALLLDRRRSDPRRRPEPLDPRAA